MIGQVPHNRRSLDRIRWSRIVGTNDSALSIPGEGLAEQVGSGALPHEYLPVPCDILSVTFSVVFCSIAYLERLQRGCLPDGFHRYSLCLVGRTDDGNSYVRAHRAFPLRTLVRASRQSLKGRESGVAPGRSVFPAETVQPVQRPCPVPVPSLRSTTLEQLWHSDEAITLADSCQECVDGSAQRIPVSIALHRYVIERIVKKDHAPGFELLCQLICHPLSIVVKPIIGVRAPADDLVALPQSIETRRHALVSIRRTQKPLPIRSDRLCASADLRPPLPSRDERERRVIPGVIADRVTGFCNFSYETWMPLCGLANQKERRTRSVSFQNLEQSGRELSMWPVVERDCGHSVLG